MTNLIGQSLGRYHILEQLGEGGMATVYKALDTRLERYAAIKVIRNDQFGAAVLEHMLKRFEREARALARLSHPNIVKVLDYGEHEGSPYLVMEYLPGGTLKQKLAGRRVSWQDALRVLTPIAQALAYAHENRIIHRDIKPSNVLITKSGEPMLSDFGIARILEDNTATELTTSGAGIGTPEYMAPEQGLGQSDERADIYALGIVFYQMVTGHVPFRADTPMAVLLKKSTEPLPRPSQFVRDLPESVENLLVKMLARDPAHRYQTVGELLAAFARLARGETIAVTRAAIPPPAPVPNWKQPVLWAGAAFLLVSCLVLGVAAGWWIWRGANPADPVVSTSMPATVVPPPTVTELPPVVMPTDASPTPLPPSPTAVPTATPYVPPTVVSNDPSPYDQNNPEGLFYWYFDYICTVRDYNTTWGFLSDRYKQAHNSGGFESSYAKLWRQVEKVTVDSVEYQGPRQGLSHYKVTLTLYYKNGISETVTANYYIYYDQTLGHWMFDTPDSLSG